MQMSFKETSELADFKTRMSRQPRSHLKVQCAKSGLLYDVMLVMSKMSNFVFLASLVRIYLEQ